MKRRRRKRDTTNDFSQYLPVDFYKYSRLAADIWKSAKYNSTIKLFVAQYDDKDFVCRISIKLPKDLKARCRPCVSKVIEKCDDTEKWDKNILQYCANYTSIIYDIRNKQAYRNKHCAECNHIETENLTGCPIMSRTQIG